MENVEYLPEWLSPVASELLSLPSTLKFDVSLIFTSILEAICGNRILGNASDDSVGLDCGLIILISVLIGWITRCLRWLSCAETRCSDEFFLMIVLLLDAEDCGCSFKFDDLLEYVFGSSIDLFSFLLKSDVLWWIRCCDNTGVVRSDCFRSSVLAIVLKSSVSGNCERFSLDSVANCCSRNFLPSSMSSFTVIRFFSVSISRCASSSALRSDTTVWCNARTVSNDWNATVVVGIWWSFGRIVHICWCRWWQSRSNRWQQSSICSIETCQNRFVFGLQLEEP